MTDTHREHQIVQTFIAFADALVDDFDVLDLTTRLAEDCTRLLNVTAAGLLLADGTGVLHVLAATSEQASRLEAFQLQRDEGPCLDCYHSGQPISVTDLSTETARWPRFTAAAAQQGFASVHALPMQLRASRLGALGLFGSTPGALDENDLALAQGFAHVAALAIAADERANDRARVLSGLQATVRARAQLEMAKGVLAEVLGLDMQEAFLRLRAHAHRHGRHLTDVAHDVVSASAAVRGRLMSELSEPASSSS